MADLFKRCDEFTTADDAKSMGLYPYFLTISHTEGTEVMIDDKLVTLQIWDTAGQARLEKHHLHKSCSRRAAAGLAQLLAKYCARVWTGVGRLPEPSRNHYTAPMARPLRMPKKETPKNFLIN